MDIAKRMRWQAKMRRADIGAAATALLQEGAGDIDRLQTANERLWRLVRDARYARGTRKDWVARADAMLRGEEK